MATTAKKVLRIRWTNKLSGDQGYVKTVQAAKGYFENTFEVTEARKFRTQAECEKAIATILTFEEGAQNDYEVISE